MDSQQQAALLHNKDCSVTPAFIVRASSTVTVVALVREIDETFSPRRKGERAGEGLRHSSQASNLKYSQLERSEESKSAIVVRK
jgi:hypothetical protein